MNFGGMLDTWQERGGATAAAGIGLRFALWYWKRRSPIPPKATPFFGFIARRLEAETLLALMTLKYRTMAARVETLETQMRGAGLQIDSSSPDGAASSSDLPASTLRRSQPNGNEPSASTPSSPASTPVR